jgi:hypothetical protein
MRAVVVPAEGPVVPLDLPDEGSALEVLQAAVGGMIEALPLPYREGDKATCYVNEEGGRFEAKLADELAGAKAQVEQYDRPAVRCHRPGHRRSVRFPGHPAAAARSQRLFTGP